MTDHSAAIRLASEAVEQLADEGVDFADMKWVSGDGCTIGNLGQRFYELVRAHVIKTELNPLAASEASPPVADAKPAEGEPAAWEYWTELGGGSWALMYGEPREDQKARRLYRSPQPCPKCEAAARERPAATVGNLCNPWLTKLLNEGRYENEPLFTRPLATPDAEWVESGDGKIYVKTSIATPDDLSKLYHELLYAVARKFPDETRHQTALRYIQNAENRACEGPQQAAMKGDSDE